MDMTKKIRMIAIDKGIRIGDIAKQLNYDKAGFSVKLSRGVKSIDDAEKILDVLDCDIVVVDRKTKKVY